MHAWCVTRQKPLKVTLTEPVSNSGFVWVTARFRLVHLSNFLTFHRNTCSVLLTLSQTDKILAVTKLKAFSDDNCNFA